MSKSWQALPAPSVLCWFLFSLFVYCWFSGCLLTAPVPGGQSQRCSGASQTFKSLAEARQWCLDMKACEGVVEFADGSFAIR